MDKDLLCAESFCSDKMADKDNVILDDNRVLDHLLQTEVVYMPQIHSKNSDLDPSTRKIVTKWMLEVNAIFFSSSMTHFAIAITPQTSSMYHLELEFTSGIYV